MKYGRKLLTLGTFVALLGAAACGAPAGKASDKLAPPVPSDCSQDVTADFNKWLDTLDDGVTITLKPGSCYLSSGTIKFKDKHDITIIGKGATIKASGNAPLKANRAQLLFDLGGGFKMRDLTLQGSNFSADCAKPGGVSCYTSAREHDRNLQIRGSDGVLVDGVHFKNAWGDAVEVDPGGSWNSQGTGAVMSHNITVQNSTVDTTGRHAFACTGCRNMTVRDNKITNVGYHAVDVEVEGAVWTGDITLERNTYTNVYLSLLSAISGTGSDLGPFKVRGNTQTDWPVTCQWPIAVGQPGLPYHNVSIADNKVRALGPGIHVAAPDANVTGNTVEFGRAGCGNSTGINLVNVTKGSVTRNTLINPLPMTKITGPKPVVCGNRTTATGPFDQPVPC